MPAHKFKDESGLDADSMDVKSPLQVVIAYDDVAAGKRAMRVLSTLAGGLEDEIELKPIPATPVQPVEVAVRPLPVAADDFRLSIKSTARAFMEAARREGDRYETVFVDPEGRLTEGSFTSIFVERDGRYLTPPIARGLLPGLLRARLIEEGKAVEEDLVVADLANGFLIGNMVRGLIRARLA